MISAQNFQANQSSLPDANLTSNSLSQPNIDRSECSGSNQFPTTNHPRNSYCPKEARSQWEKLCISFKDEILDCKKKDPYRNTILCKSSFGANKIVENLKKSKLI